MSLIPVEDLIRAHERYLREQERLRAESQTTRPKTKAEILCEIAREDPTVTVAELAEAAERSASWVRKTLRQAGIAPAKPVCQQAPARGEQVAADRAVYERQQAELVERASVPVPTEKRPFVYVPRTAAQLEVRIQQGRRDSRRWVKPLETRKTRSKKPEKTL